MNSVLCKAIKNKQLVKFMYRDKKNGAMGERVVEPYCHGVSTKGNEVLRAYQVDGYTSSGKFDWKLYDLGNASSIQIMDQKFNATRYGYNPNDSAMKTIYCSL